jgi:hypothetical protein
MRTLLILGSMPEPSLPPKAGFDDVACANASGHSAARYGLPDPVYTVMTSMLASGIGSGRQSLEALRGLETGTVYFLRRRTERMTPIKRALFFAKNLRGKSILRMQPAYLKAQLKALGYRFGAFVALDEKYYDGLVRTLCGDDRYVIAGFSFELTHAYAHNPEIEERGTRVSAHAETDITVLRHLARQRHDLYTSEEAVHRATGIPLLPEGPAG